MSASTSALGSPAARRIREELGASNSASDDNPLLIGDVLVDKDRPVSGQPDRGDTAVLHAGQRYRGIHRRERNLARINMLRTMHPSTSARIAGGQHHACRVPHAVGALGLHDDTVRRDVEPDAVVLAEGGRIGQVRVDLADPQSVATGLFDVPADRRRPGPPHCRRERTSAFPHSHCPLLRPINPCC